jgi:type II secretory pathway component GspD/PulD (secretin)
MKKLLAILVGLTLSLAVSAQQSETTGGESGVKLVTISSKGEDVRSVLHDLFQQAGYSFILEPNVRFVLYLSLNEMEFEEALQLVCKTASLKFEIQNGVYFVGPAPRRAATNPPSGSAEAKEASAPPQSQIQAPGKAGTKQGKLPETVLSRKLTTRLEKVPLRDLFAEVSEKTGVLIEIAPGVPAYKLDAILTNVSLKYLLDNVTKATKLNYRFTENYSIEIFRPEPEADRLVVRDEQ